MKRKNSERGVSLVLLTIMLFAFLGITAIAIDLGMLYTARTSAQHAADAAALAAAFEFTNICNSATPPATGCESWDLDSAVKNSAKSIASQNGILKQSVLLEDADIVPDYVNQRVTVTVRRTGTNGVATYFARFLGVERADVLARATAEVATTGNGAPAGSTSYCLKPLFLPNTILSGEAPSVACSAGHTIFNTDGTISAWANSPPESDPTSSTKFGIQYLIRPTTPSVTKTGLAPSQFYSLDFGNGTYNGEQIGGADMYRCTLGRCLNQCGAPDLLSCGNSQKVTAIDVETGNMVGPTTQGINDLIGTENIDTYDAFLSRNPGATSRNLAVAPIWDSCNQTVNPGTNNDIKVLGFVKVFVDSVVQTGSNRGDTLAHILGPIECGDINGGGTTETPPGTPGPYTVPIRLVQQRP